MGAMPGNVCKGPILERFEKYVNSSKDNLHNTLTDYKNKPAIGDMILYGRNNDILSPANAKHIKDHWFYEVEKTERPWWPREVPMGKIVREGLIRALMMCKFELDADGEPDAGKERTQYLPIDVHWICAGSHFELVATLGHGRKANGDPTDNHVNLLILTPSTPTTRRDDAEDLYDGFDDIWVTRHAGVGPGEKDVEEPDPVAPDPGHKRFVRTVRLRREKEPTPGP